MNKTTDKWVDDDDSQDDDKITHAIISDRGGHWPQLRYQINIEGMDDWEESDDTIELALQECYKLGVEKITIYRTDAL